MNSEDAGLARMEEMLGGLADGAGIADSEWRLLQDITNGTMLFDPATIRLLHADAEEAEQEYFDKWRVSRAALLDKLRRLDALGRLAVVRRIDRMWNEGRG